MGLDLFRLRRYRGGVGSRIRMQPPRYTVTNVTEQRKQKNRQKWRKKRQEQRQNDAIFEGKKSPHGDDEKAKNI